MNERYTLIVDDEKEIRDLLSIYLSRMGFRTGQAGDVKEALEKIEKDRDLIFMLILDINIQDGDGVLLFKSVIDKGINIKTLFISGNKSNENRIKEVASNYSFLQKPFTLKEFEKEIGILMNN